MKNLFLTIVLVCVAILSQATTHHVDQNQNRPAGYIADLQTAVNLATAGDTIFVYPASNDYGHITIKKKLHLFGFGYDGTQGFGSRIANLYLDTTTSPSSSPTGSTFQGFTFDNVIANKGNINNIGIFGCYIISSYISIAAGSSGWTIKNNLIQNYIQINNCSNILISNNVFVGSNNNGIHYSNANTVVISNNLFCNWYYFYNVTNAIASNNIFLCSSPTNQTHMYNNQFINNLSWKSTADPYVLPPVGNTGTNNKSNVNPLFETALSSGTYDKTKDYHLKATSPGKNAGSDGTDIGPYGGPNPFVWGGAFTIPKVTEMLITNPVVNQGTNINVKLKAKKAEL
jgi:hypothetical protein